jgi:hypothetical protein
MDLDVAGLVPDWCRSRLPVVAWFADRRALPVSPKLQRVFHFGGEEIRSRLGKRARYRPHLPLSPVSSRRLRSAMTEKGSMIGNHHYGTFDTFLSLDI